MGILGNLIGAITANRTSKKQDKLAKGFASESEAWFPELDDFEQRVVYNEMKRKSDSYGTGSFNSSIMDELNSSFSNITQAAMTLGSGGGADINSLMKAGGALGDSWNKTLGVMEQTGIEREKMTNDLLSSLSQRKVELELMKHQEFRADSQRYQEASEQNKQAAMAGFGSFADGIVSMATTMGMSGGLDALKGLAGGSNSGTGTAR